MIIAWRLLPAKHQHEAFTGEGARIAGGRWNLRGTRAVYLSSSMPLAAIETLLFTGDVALGIPYVVFRVEIPNEVAAADLPPKSLPSTWRVEPAPESVKRLGSEWISAGTGVLLRVPSVVLAKEYNYLINPAHADFPKLRISKPEPFFFNPRNWKP
jgi:RES domain-containing protein